MATRFSHKVLISLISVLLVVSPLTPVFAEEAIVSSSLPVSLDSQSEVLPLNTSSTSIDVEPILEVPVQLQHESQSQPEPVFESQPESVSSTSEIVSSTENIPTQAPEAVIPAPKRWHYKTLMRSARQAEQEGSVDQKNTVAQNISEFVDQEKQTLDTLGVESEKQKKYFDRLHLQSRLLDKTQSTVFEKVKDFLGNIFGNRVQNRVADDSTVEEKTPVNPATFHFSEDAILVEPLQNPVLHPTVGQKIQTELKNFITIPAANAMEDQYLPVLQDVQAASDVPQSDTLTELARSLHNNPVEIANFVKNSIRFEPYFGLKKGALGCLEQKVCNDVDAAALTIALMRSSGIPAHYKKSLAIFSVADLKNLLGVDDIKAVFALFAMNKVLVYTVTVPIPAGATLDQVDLSAETSLAVQWVVPEIFFEYDEQGGNQENDYFSTATSTEALRTELGSASTKQWIPIDVIFRPYSHQKNLILSERANINVTTFWNNFLTFQGNVAPLQKLRTDIQTTLGVSATSSLSVVTVGERKFSRLPVSFPFVFTSAVQNGNAINEEVWSTVPDALRPQLRISLLTTNNQTILEKNFFTTELDNKEMSLNYEGLGDADKRVIEQYGGIPQTPAELVDIVPYFQSASGRIYADNRVGVNIGDTLTLRFEMFIGGQSIQRDEKFSVAGNSEGIYIVFSGVMEKPEYNTSQRILAGGNAALAWKYLAHIEEERKFLNGMYDFSSNLHFARAVVTENRILTLVNNSPTTFDFKGLTIDAGAYLAADVSRRDAYIVRRTDVRKLFGLEASFYEGKLFEEVAGLDGISTVRGLQYAASQPQTYSILRITRANEAIIDGLPFSANTKQNMHTAVRAGNTVITPNRVVQMGNWRGVLYINLSPAGTGQYAIGEQAAQNGGWTIALLQSRLYQVTPQDVREGFLAHFGNSNFYYEDGKNYDTVLCRITDDEFNLITRNANWRAEYGYPCFTENKAFGNVLHTYILSSNGTYFFSPGLYDYWISRDNVKGVLLTDKNGEASERLMNVRLDGEFKFNPIAGTYSWFGHYDGPAEDWNMFADCRDCITAYYQPMQNSVGRGRLVYGSILRKLSESHYDAQRFLCSAQDAYCSKRNWILNNLGFPLMNRAPAAKSIAESTGDYQAFVGGHVYRKNDWGKSLTYYVPNEILQKFNADEFLLNGNRGTGGRLGFPISDPFFVVDSNSLLQKFESKMIQLRGNRYDIVSLVTKERKLNIKNFAEIILDKVMLGQISDAEAFARLSDYIAFIAENDTQFVKDLTQLLIGAERVISLSAYKELRSKDQNEFQWGNNTLLGIAFSDTGFKFQYNDSHYGGYFVTSSGESYRGCVSNQLLHSMGGFNTAYFWSDSVGIIGSLMHDSSPSPLGKNGNSIEDLALAFKMASLGEDLASGRIQKENIGMWIRNNLKDERESPPKRREDIINECKIRTEFRKFEKNTFGQNFGNWMYFKDIEFINGVYSQYYEKFGDRTKVRAIWDPQQNRVVLNP